MSDPVIRVQGVSKAYRIWHSPAARLKSIGLHIFKHLVPPLWARCNAAQARLAHDFYALQSVTLEVRKGESIGIVGRNGSGKSTLLQIIAGTLAPTAGTVEVNGRVAALLELGSGFNPEYTGRENVFLNASILGLAEEKIRARFDAIVAFAEIGEFIERPVKTYSSGMVVRLAFAVAAHVDAEILIIDEALAVGDARFQLKCARAIDRFVAQGVTLFFVSHDLSSVKRLCSRAILIEQGRCLHFGNPNEVANLYTKLIAEGGSADALKADIEALVSGRSVPGFDKRAPTSAAAISASEVTGVAPTNSSSDEAQVQALRTRLKAMETMMALRPDASEISKRVEALLDDERAGVQISGQEFSYGGELGVISDLAIVDRDDQPRNWFGTGEPVVVKMTVESRTEVFDPIYALTIKNQVGMEIYGTNTLFSHQRAPAIAAGESREVRFAFDLNLAPGQYFLSFGFSHFSGNDIVVIQRRYDAIKIDVHAKDRIFGVANLNAIITTRERTPSTGEIPRA